MEYRNEADRYNAIIGRLIERAWDDQFGLVDAFELVRQLREVDAVYVDGDPSYDTARFEESRKWNADAQTGV